MVLGESGWLLGGTSLIIRLVSPPRLAHCIDKRIHHLSKSPLTLGCTVPMKTNSILTHKRLLLKCLIAPTRTNCDLDTLIALVLPHNTSPSHLAETWSQTYLPPSHPLTSRRLSYTPTVLSTIDHLILFDLLGNKQCRINSYYRETDWLFDEMRSADLRLREAGLVEVEEGEGMWFGGARLSKGMIGDDHVPVSSTVIIASSRG